MRPFQDVLNDLRGRIVPFDDQGAKVAIVIYHPESMDAPHAKVFEMTREQLAASSNRKLADIIRDNLDMYLIEMFSKWRGA